MTTEEKLAKLDEATIRLRHAARHNGARLSRDASLREVAAVATDHDAARVRAMWQDIATIDRVKRLVQFRTQYPVGYRMTSGTWYTTTNAYQQVPLELPKTMTAQELLEYAVDDERLTEKMHSWAVVRITAAGTEVLTCGGGCYQPWKMAHRIEDESGEEVDMDDHVPVPNDAKVVYYFTRYEGEEERDFLLHEIEQEDACWSACTWSARFADAKRYAEGSDEWFWFPCELPADAEKLVSICITRRNASDGTAARALNYSLTEQNCDSSTPGVIALPHGIWLIGDNGALASAPKGVLVPRGLADGSKTGMVMDDITIVYNKLETGTQRLRLLSDAFGDEYIIYAIDGIGNTEGTWNE